MRKNKVKKEMKKQGKTERKTDRKLGRKTSKMGRGLCLDSGKNIDANPFANSSCRERHKNRAVLENVPRNPRQNFHLSYKNHKTPNVDNINNNNNNSKNLRAGADRTRRWEGMFNIKPILLITIPILILIISAFILVSALTEQDRISLKNELNNLTSQLEDSGYGWLINYSVDYSNINEAPSKVEVYRENDNTPIASFDNITSAGWYKIFLSNLSENETQDVFDLRVLGSVEFDYIVDPTMVISGSGINVTILSPENNSNFNTQTVEFNVSADGTLSWCGLSLDLGANSTMTLNASSTFANFTNTTMTETQHNFTITCNDTSNNFGLSSQYTLLVDITIPQVNFTNPTPTNATTQSSNSVYVNVTSSDTNQHSTFLDWNNSLVLWMRMDDRKNATYIYDNSSYGNNGTVYGATYTQAGKLGGAYGFDGVNDYVGVSDNPSLNFSGTNFSLSMWVLHKKDETTFPIIKVNEFYVEFFGGYYAGEGFKVCARNATSSDLCTSELGPGTIPLNTWGHIVITYDMNQLRAYANGIFKKNKTIGGGMKDGSNLLQIGSYQPTYYWNGTIDDVMIFSRALSSTEISSLYNATQSQYYNNFTSLSDGDYTYKAYAQDIAGNTNNTELRTISIDTTTPDINLTYPLNTTYNVNISAINYTVSGTPQACWYSTDNGDTNTSVTCGTNLTGLTSSEGSNTWLVGANDSANNINSSSVTFTKDTVIPTLTITSPTNDSNFNIQSVEFNVSSNEVVNYCGLSLDGGANITMGLNASSTFANFTNTTMTETQHNFTMTCNDTANNFGLSSQYTLLVDITIPQVNFTNPTPDNATTQSANSVYVNVTSSDTNQHSTFLDWNNSLVLWMRMDDRKNATYIYDNSSYGNNGTVIGDATYTSAGKYGGAYSFDGVNDYVDLGDISYSNNVTRTWSLWLYNKQNAANKAFLSKWKHVISDTFLFQYDANGAGKLFIANSSTDGGGNAGTVPSGTFTTNAWQHVVVVYNGSGATNSSRLKLYVSTSEITLTYAGTIPSSLVDSTANLEIGGVTSISRYFNGTIDDVLIFNRALSSSEISALYNATQYQYYNNFTGLSDATYTYKAYTQDIAGNVNNTEQRQVTIDSIIPDINLTYPLNITYNINVSNLNYTTGGTPQACWYSTDNGDTNTSVTCGVNLTDLTSSEGSNTWLVGVNDSANNLNTSSITFFKDTINPNLTITHPTDTNYSTRSIILNYTVSSDAQACWFSNNTWANNNTLTCGVNTTVYFNSDSYKTIYMGVNDSSNNINTSSINFNIDTAYPSISIISPLNNTNSSDTGLNVNFTVSDTNLQACWYSNDTYSGNTTLTCGNNITDVTWIQGQHNVTTYANDSANNVNESSVTFSIDSISPSITLISPDDAYSTTSTSTTFQYNVSDIHDTNCSLILDDSIINFNASVFVNTTTNQFTNTTSVATHVWSINCTDIYNNIGNSTNRTLTITAVPVTTTTSADGGGGGGGGTYAPIAGVRVNPTGMSLYGTAGISDIGKISITNNKDTGVTVGINLVNIGEIIKLKETSMDLAPKESKILDFDYIAEKAGLYTGKIVLSSVGQLIQIPIALNIKSGKSLFDVSVDIPDKYKTISPGNKLISQITLIQAGTQEKMDVTLNYLVKDFDGKTHLQQSETIAVLGQKSLTKEFSTQNLPAGDYVVGTEVIYAGGVATASSHFSIKEPAFAFKNLVILGVLLAALIVFILLILIIKRYKRAAHLYKNIRKK